MIYANEVFGYPNRNIENSELEENYLNTFRVIATFQENVAAIDLEKDQVVPYWISVTDIELMLSEGEIVALREPFLIPASDQGISKKAKERRNKIAPTVIYYWENFKPELLDPTKRNKLFHQIAEQYSLSFNKVRRSFTNFWQKGMTENALLDNYSRCGCYGMPKLLNVNSEKLGAKVKPRLGMVQDQGRRVTLQDKRNIETSVKKYYYTREQKTLKDVYDIMCEEYYRVKILDQEGNIIERKEIPGLPDISYRQFLYWYYVIRDPKKEMIGRNGNSYYLRNLRPLHGSALDGVIGPGSRYQIDSTIADIYLQLEHGDMAFGRPVIYGMIDVFTGMIVALHISVNPASWTEASSCLLNMVEDKVKFCAKYDIQITEDMWPSRHIPSAILSDRAEFVSELSRNFTLHTGITIKHAPPFRADMKNLVEQHFNIYNGPTQRYLPGAVRKNYGERGEKRPELEAFLTLKEFTQIIISLVLKHNVAGFRRLEGAKERFIIPISEWEQGIKNNSGSLRVVTNLNSYKLSLMTSEKGTVTQIGFKWKCLLYNYYNVKEANQKKVFLYDQRDMSTIYFPNRDWTNYTEVSLKGFSRRKYLGWSLDEILFDFDRINDENALKKKAKHEADVNSVGYISDKLKESKSYEDQYAKPETKAEVLNGKQERRKLASNKYNLKFAIRLTRNVPVDHVIEVSKTEPALTEKIMLKNMERLEAAMKLQNEQQKKEKNNG